MASSGSHSLFITLSIFLGLFAIGANARPGHFHPCKTLFISSFTFSSSSSSTLNPNHEILLNPNSIFAGDENPSEFFAIFSEINGIDPKQQQPFEIFLDRVPDFESFSRSELRFPRHQIPFRHYEKPEILKQEMPYESIGVSSLRERTKDILSVVVALLFGAGCGALTSATMYLAWSLITNRYEYRGTDDSDSEFDDRDDDDVTLSKMGYVKIPSAAAAAATVDSKVPAPTKEVV